jgi:hypothetical protein
VFIAAASVTYDAVIAFCDQLAVPNNDPVNDVAVTFVLTCNPLFGDIDADTDPDAIWDKFNPTIPDAGILNKLAPEPLNEPLNESATTLLLTNNPFSDIEAE